MTDFRPAPKPPVSPPPAKPRRVKRKNVRRSTAAFAHNYCSLERVLWVKAQKCCWCEALGEEQGSRSENAHTGEQAGMSLKAHYSTIIPLCHTHHVMYDEYQHPLDEPFLREQLKALAASVHTLYESFGGF